MGFVPRSSSELSEIFEQLSSRLRAWEVVPFFGTLLGLARNGAPIDGDDDLDFATDTVRLRKISEAIKDDPKCKKIKIIESRVGLAHLSFEFDLENSRAVQVDIFGYKCQEDVVVFPVHWRDENEDEKLWLRVPTSIKAIEAMLSRDANTGDSLHLHEDVDELLQYLYGDMWRTPLRKNVDYRVDMLEGKPTYTLYKPLKRLQRSKTYAVLVWLENHPQHIATKTLKFLAKFLSQKSKDNFFSH